MFARLAATSVALAALTNAVPQVIDAAAGTTIQVTPGTKYQVYDGTGISEAFQRSLVLHVLDAKSQDLALDLLFSNKTGAGFTILRNGIGSSPTDPFDHMKSIEPNSPGLNYSIPNYIPLPRNDEYQVWLTKQAISRGVYSIYADAWSADGYMKTNGTDTYGGYICGVTNATCATGDWRQAYANKLVKYLQDYANNGIYIQHVGFLNEPDLSTPYASMQSSGQQAADFLEVFYPTLQKSGLPTKIACCDGSGWEQQRSRLQGIQAAGAEKYLDIVTSHGYSSTLGSPFNTSLRVWETEWSTFDPINYAWHNNYYSDGLAWANRIQEGYSVSNVSAFFYWWGAANATDNEALIFVNGTNSVEATKRLWAYAHFGSRVVQPGAYRVDAKVNSAALNVTAFTNPSGTTAVQVINNSNTTQTFTIKGIKVPNVQNAITTYFTDETSDFDTGVGVISQDKNQIVAQMPGFSLMSFIVAAS